MFYWLLIKYSIFTDTHIFKNIIFECFECINTFRGFFEGGGQYSSMAEPKSFPESNFFPDMCIFNLEIGKGRRETSQLDREDGAKVESFLFYYLFLISQSMIYVIGRFHTEV